MNSVISFTVGKNETTGRLVNRDLGMQRNYRRWTMNYSALPRFVVAAVESALVESGYKAHDHVSGIMNVGKYEVRLHTPTYTYQKAGSVVVTEYDDPTQLI